MAWNLAEWVIAGSAAVMIGMAKTGLGGLGMIAVVVMASILPARESTGMILTLLIVADVFAVCAFRRHARWPLVLRLLPAATVGIVCGFLIMPAIPSEVFGRVIGGITIFLLGWMVIQRRNPGLAETAAKHGAFLAGWSGGVVTMLANAAGPIMSIYLLACRLPKLEFVGTAAWFFFAVNLIKVPFSASMGLINPASLQITAILAPLVISGAFFGKWILGKLNQRLFEWIMIGFALVAAIRLLVS